MPNFSAVALKIAKIGNFWYIFGQKGYIPLSNFYKIWNGVSQIPTVVRTFTIVALKMWPYGRKSPKIAIFGINLPPRKNPGGLQRNFNIGGWSCRHPPIFVLYYPPIVHDNQVYPFQSAVKCYHVFWFDIVTKSPNSRNTLIKFCYDLIILFHL